MFRNWRESTKKTSLPLAIYGKILTREADGELQTTALEIEDNQVVAIYVMRNPEKMKHLH